MSESDETVKIGRMLSVSEMFGPTLQGEGPSQGMPAFFIRLGLCNLDCRWCDTPYTWDWTGKNGYAFSKQIELKRMSVDDVYHRCKTSVAPNLIVITGGEPMLQQRSMLDLAKRLIADGHRIEIETNGTVMPEDGWEPLAHGHDVHFNVSPKLWNSGVAADDAIKIDVLRRLYEMGATFKFVVKAPACIMQVNGITQEVGVFPQDVYLMPEGRSQQEILDALPQVFDDCIHYGYNLTPRMHVLAYGSKRGI
jgi:organic radical activating enzyme